MIPKHDPATQAERHTAPLPRHEPLIPLAEMVARIEAIRAQESPCFHCAACGSDVPITELIARRKIA